MITLKPKQIFIASILCSLILSSGFTPAQDRLALLIGNNQYPEDGNFRALKNCVNDVTLLEKTLRSVGFKVRTLTNGTQAQMDEALLEFENSVSVGGTALVYFAGHGIEYEGQNYLMGSNAKLQARSRLGEEALKAETFAAAMVQAGAKTSFLLLDCCRELPASADWAGRGQKKFGLADISIEGDIVIAMAASPGKQALEPIDAGGNSPYALALAKWIPSGLKHTDLFDQVRLEVNEITEDQQRTWENGSFLHPFHFATGASPNEATMLKGELEQLRREKEAAEKALASAKMNPIPRSTVPASTESSTKNTSLPDIGFFTNEEVFQGGKYASYTKEGKIMMLYQVQKILKSGGNGEMGVALQGAIAEFQEANGLPVTGRIDDATIIRMKLPHYADYQFQR